MTTETTTAETPICALPTESLEQRLENLEQKIIRGKADSNTFETFIAGRLEWRKRTVSVAPERSDIRT